MVPPPHGIPLAAHIISSFYGDLCCKVCECLLRRGTLTLGQIIRFTELSRDNVVNCLRVLIHQNCVQAFVFVPEEGAPELTQYMALFDNIIHKSRATKFLQIVSEELGEICEGILLGLIQHGRLSIDQIIDREKQTFEKKKQDRDKEDPKSDVFDEQAVRDSFKRLLSTRFVERCPEPGPVLSPPSEDKPPAKKRGAKSAKIAEQTEQTLEQRALAAAAPMESIRFLMEIDDISGEKDDESMKSRKVGMKRKGDALDSDVNVLDINRKKEVLWRVNFEEFLWRLLHKACISYVKTRINNEASIVLSAILDLSGSETRLKAEKSPYLSINNIYDEVIKKDSGVGMDLERVQNSLEQLGCQTLSTDIDESYSVDIKSIIEMAQNEEVESVVFKRYGKDAYKIFRLLLKAGRYVEIDKISESTFVGKKETAKILFQLWKDAYLEMQSFAPNTINKPPAFYLWKVDPQSFRRLFLDEMYQAVLNIRLRIAYEQDQKKELLQLPKDKLDGPLKGQRMVYTQVRVTLERSLLELDDAIVLFHHLQCKINGANAGREMAEIKSSGFVRAAAAESPEYSNTVN